MRVSHATVQAVLALGLSLIVPLAVMGAEQHVVPPSELQSQVASASQARQASVSQLEQFFSSAHVKKILRTARIDGRNMREAFSLLSDDELRGLAARAQKAQADFAAGALSNEHLTYIIIALATAVLVLILVKR